MSGLQLPAIPASLKPIQHYLKAAQEHETRDPVITYWCRLYSLQTALKIDRKSDEARAVLVQLMSWLETQKKNLADNEAITNDVAAQAHIENYALKLFTWADSQDRAGNFNKNVVKAFYTAGMVMDVLNTFGELTDEISTNCKYAKWKAAYIHNCLKNGETPIPGPVGWEEENELQLGGTSQDQAGPSIGFNLPDNQGGSDSGPRSDEFNDPPPTVPRVTFDPPKPETSWEQPPQSSYTPNIPAATPANTEMTREERIAAAGYPVLEPTQITKAQKYCKFAASALNYDDIPEAVSNLQKALRLLQTGQDS